MQSWASPCPSNRPPRALSTESELSRESAVRRSVRTCPNNGHRTEVLASSGVELRHATGRVRGKELCSGHEPRRECMLAVVSDSEHDGLSAPVSEEYKVSRFRDSGKELVSQVGDE